jgi:hypothetical protein
LASEKRLDNHFYQEYTIFVNLVHICELSGDQIVRTMCLQASSVVARSAYDQPAAANIDELVHRSIKTFTI